MISIRDIDFSKSVVFPNGIVTTRPSDFGFPDCLGAIIPVSIAVLDTGYPVHSGLRLYGTHSSNNYADFVGNEHMPWDRNGHATAVSGIIAGKTDRFVGLCPSALMSYVKCIDDDGGTTIKKISAGLLWAAARKIDIAVVAAGSHDEDRYLEEVISKCIQRGMIIVAAGKSNSGKKSKDVFPGKSPNVVSCFFGEKTSVKVKSGLGIDVCIGHRSAWTLAPDDRYIRLGGSSMACAIVSGYMASHLASGMTKERLFEKMKDIGSCH